MDVKARGAKWLSLALCLTAGFSLSACSDDDEGGNGGAGSGVAAQQMPKVADAGIQFPVTQYSEDSYGIDETYMYSDGRMTGGSNSYGGRYSITSNPLVVTESSDYGDEFLRNIKVNGNGFIVSMDWYENDNVSEVKRGTFNFEYDAEGHLVREFGQYEDLDEMWHYTNTYTWENGNLVAAEYSDRGEDGGVYTHSCTFTYDTSRWLNPGIYHPVLIDISTGGGIWPILFYSGLLGHPTRNIPATWVEVADDEYRCSCTTTAVNTNMDSSVSSVDYDLSMETYYDGGTVYRNTGSGSYRYGYADYPIQQEQSGYSVAPSEKSSKAVRSIRARRMMRR